MTVQEVSKLIVINRTSYPHLYKGHTDADLQALVANWAAQLKDIPAELGLQAFLLAQRKAGSWPVSIGQMFEALEEITAQSRPNTGTLWHACLKAAHAAYENYGCYNFTARLPDGRTQGQAARDRNEALWSSLPLEIRDWAGGISTLIDMDRRSTADLEQYVRPGFERAVAQARHADVMALPDAPNYQKLEE